MHVDIAAMLLNLCT